MCKLSPITVTEHGFGFEDFKYAVLLNSNKEIYIFRLIGWVDHLRTITVVCVFKSNLHDAFSLFNPKEDNP